MRSDTSPSDSSNTVSSPWSYRRSPSAFHVDIHRRSWLSFMMERMRMPSSIPIRSSDCCSSLSGPPSAALTDVSGRDSSTSSSSATMRPLSVPMKSFPSSMHVAFTTSSLSPQRLKISVKRLLTSFITPWRVDVNQRLPS